MEISELFDYLIAGYGVWEISVMVILAASFFIQLRYYAFLYNRMAEHKGGKAGTKAGISVVSIIRGCDYNYLEETLPLLLRQEYPDFEIVLVDLSGDPDFSKTLSVMTEADNRIAVTKIPVNPLLPVSNKLALNVGIKSARNENILITTTDTIPVSAKWIDAMAREFTDSDIILGYCGLEKKEGFKNSIMRLSLTASAMRSQSAALRGKPYRGYAGNIGFTKGVYFAGNGFNYLNLNIGEDDLFIQHMVSKIDSERIGIAAGPDVAVRRRQWDEPGWWFRKRLLLSNSFRFYPRNVKQYIGLELWSRVLFFAAIMAAVIILPFELKILAAGLLVIRFAVVCIQTGRVSRRICEKGLWRALPVYDLLSPFYEALLAINRSIKRTPGLWK